MKIKEVANKIAMRGDGVIRFSIYNKETRQREELFLGRDEFMNADTKQFPFGATVESIEICNGAVTFYGSIK